MVVRDFDYYLERKIVKRTINVERSKSLSYESENTYASLVEYVDCIGIHLKNSNMIIKMTYDVVMELIRARMLSDGFISSGYGAHEAEVAYLGKLGFSRSDVLFVDKLRYFRNGIMYYGKVFDKDYTKKVLNFVKRIRGDLVR